MLRALEGQTRALACCLAEMSHHTVRPFHHQQPTVEASPRKKMPQFGTQITHEKRSCCSVGLDWFYAEVVLKVFFKSSQEVE